MSENHELFEVILYSLSSKCFYLTYSTLYNNTDIYIHIIICNDVCIIIIIYFLLTTI